MQINQIFTTPVAITKFTREFTEQEYLFFEKESTERVRNSYNSASKNSFVLNEPEMKNIREVIEEELKNYQQRIMCTDDVELYITQSWLNFIEPGEAHHKHNHGNSYVSGVLYINADIETDKIVFSTHNPISHSYFTYQPKEFHPWNSNSWFFNVGKYTIVLFPSYIPHEVGFYQGAETRVSLAFNTFVKGKFGDLESYTSLEL